LSGGSAIPVMLAIRRSSRQVVGANGIELVASFAKQ
jgi:hypothetical protein